MRAFFIICSLLLLLGACNNESSCEVEGIVVPSILSHQASKSGFAYCHVLRKALGKDSLALVQFIRFAYKTDDDSAIDHGLVFAQLALQLGDDYLLPFVKGQHEEHRLLAAKMFDAALEYGDPIPPLAEELPKTFDFLMQAE